MIKTIKIIIIGLFVFMGPVSVNSQKVGVGTTGPLEKLDVIGKVKMNSIILNNGGIPFEFLKKNNVAGEVGFRKAQGGLGLNYIICMNGSFPNQSGSLVAAPVIGEIQLFAGNFAPAGWALCEGQLIPVVQNTALFAIITTTYGGNGQTNFALPDLRSTTALGKGIALPAGYEWLMGEKVY